MVFDTGTDAAVTVAVTTLLVPEPSLIVTADFSADEVTTRFT